MAFWWDPLSLGGGQLLLDVVVEEPAAEPPGPTLDALQAGGTNMRFVVGFYGYPYLVSSAPSTPTLEAWSTNGDWSQCLGSCLYVDMENSQSIDPWRPFGDGGDLTLRIAPDAADTFGIDTHRATAGAETFLANTTGVVDTPLTVLSTSAFDASGTAHIGTEAFTYSGKTGTTFTGCTRGVFSPFTTDPSGGGFVPGQFGQRHEVTTDSNAINLQPLITEQPRPVTWPGKWMGLWAHLWSEENQLLNVRDDAQLMFAGRVVSVADDPSTGTTAVECEHVLDVVKRAVIGPDWTARLKEGMYLDSGTGWRFKLNESTDGGASHNDADDLVVVSSGATGAYQVNEGFYNHDELCTVINTWLTQAVADGDIEGEYHIELGPYGPSTGPTRTHFSYNIVGSTGTKVFFAFSLPRAVAAYFGDLGTDPGGGPFKIVIEQPGSVGSTDYDRVSDHTPPRHGFIPNDVNDLSIFEVEDERGTFVDQRGYLPAEVNQTSGATDVGLIMIGNQAIFGVQKFGTRLSAAVPITSVRLAGQQRGAGIYDFITASGLTVDDPDPALEVKQVLFVQDSLANILKKIFFTTTGEGYNHVDYDAFPYQLGLAIPGEILPRFADSCDALPGADATFTLVLEKLYKIEDIFTGELAFRFAFLRWVNEGLEFYSWATPTTGDVLSESNKASPVGTQDEPRAATVLDTKWQRQIIKVDYDRDVNALDFGSGFRSSLTLVDKVAVDDSGNNAKPQTLQLRGTYGLGDVEALKSQFKSTASLFTRPVRISTRTIDSRFFEGYSVGDCVLVTDAYARDPDTGQRGVAVRPGIITRHEWSLGGEGPNGSVGDVGGEVDVMFLDLLRIAKYVPTAVLDETSTNAGYVVATKIATCRAHEYSEATEAADASYFTAGRKIRFVEIDPSDPASPSTHDDTVASQSGNTITLTTGFAAFSNTRRYKIIFDTYGDSLAEQQAGFVYQADDTDGMIEDTRAPFQYTSPPTVRGSANAADDEIELPANMLFGDGAGRDVGTDVSVNRLINNILDFKCTLSQPYIDTTELSGSGVSGTWLLVECCPIWLTAEQWLNTHTRKLKVAPWIKSSVGLSLARVRVSVVRNRPTGASLEDVDRGVIISEATFSSTSTTYAIPTAEDLPLAGIKNNSGRAYLLIECTSLARSRGLAICQESERFITI